MLKSGGMLAQKDRQKGFTIVELMVALSVLSSILLMSTFIMIQISSLYTKGVNTANLQNANRNLLGDLSGSLQLSGHAPKACTAANDANTGLPTCYTNPVSDGVASHGNPVTHNYSGPHGTGARIYAYCINTTRYTYLVGYEQGTDHDGTVVPHVLWKDTIKAPADCWPLDITGDRVVNDDAANGTPGEDNKGFNLLSDHMRLTSFTVSELRDSLYSIDLGMAYGDTDLLLPDQSLCKGGIGQQYCSTSKLSTTVTRRVE